LPAIDPDTGKEVYPDLNDYTDVSLVLIQDVFGDERTCFSRVSLRYHFRQPLVSFLVQLIIKISSTSNSRLLARSYPITNARSSRLTKPSMLLIVMYYKLSCHVSSIRFIYD
jgi:hypothetical protein